MSCLKFNPTVPNGTYLSPDSATIPVSSPDGAQRNPGQDDITERFPRISLSLHAGYWLRLCCPGAVPRSKALK
jgi:hypothetical protein